MGMSALALGIAAIGATGGGVYVFVVVVVVPLPLRAGGRGGAVGIGGDSRRGGMTGGVCSAAGVASVFDLLAGGGGGFLPVRDGGAGGGTFFFVVADVEVDASVAAALSSLACSFCHSRTKSLINFWFSGSCVSIPISLTWFKRLIQL
jgi:hypothetical protein